VTLVGAAIVMWVGDAVTIPLLLSPINSEPPVRVAVEFVRGAGLAEGAQYLVGLLGALVAQQQVWALALLFLPTALVYFAFRSAKEMHEGTRRILESMADAVDLRDPSTGGHSRRVTELTQAIVQELGRSGPEADLIVAAARVHDIGKIGVPDYILKKEGLLTPAERALMEAHVDHGAELLARYPDFARGADIVRHHHERWDGQGYPHRLKASEIPFGARVVAVADSYDAMTTDRPYRRALPVAEALLVLRTGRGHEWDPVVVDAFLRTVERLGLAEVPAVPLRIVPTNTASDVTA
jgi:putative nucleotidyltransferase with HDIG domain